MLPDMVIALFDFPNDFPYNWNLTLLLRPGIRDGRAPSTFARNGMFGKRGETPPLPRNCERARPSNRRAVNARQDPPTEAAQATGRERSSPWTSMCPRKSGDRFRRAFIKPRLRGET